MSDEKILREATFSPKAPMYYTVNATIIYVVFLVLPCLGFAPVTFGLSLLGLVLPAALFGLTMWYYRVYYRRLSCSLTNRKLIIGRGILSRTEQAVPLDKITDMQMNQGPIMRWLDLEAIKVETAGSMGGVGGALVGLVGIEGSRDFRAAVLDQRDKVVGSADRDAGAPDSVRSGTPGDTDALLTDIRDTLQRIETRLANESA